MLNVRLHEAVKAGKLENLSYLLEECNADIDATDRLKGNNLLHTAVIARRQNCVQYLVGVAPYLAWRKNDTGRTPVHLACYPSPNVEILEAMVALNKAVNRPNDDDTRTPLHLVVQSVTPDGLRATEMLLYHKADINARDKNGDSPLDIAAKVGNTDVVRLLLDRRAQLLPKNLLNFNVGERWPIYQMLFQYAPWCINHNLGGGTTLLMRVAKYGTVEQISELLRLGADPKAKSERGMTALSEAVLSGDLEAVEVLLDAGCDPLVVNKPGHSLLALACLATRNAEEMLQYLLQLEIFQSSSFTIASPENHPQTIVLREKRSPKLLKIIVESHLCDRDLINRENFTNLKLLKNFDTDQMPLGPVSYLLNNPEIHQVTDETTWELLSILIDAGFPLKNGPGVTPMVPPLTILANCEMAYVPSVDQIMNLIHQLISNGAVVNDMSVPLSDELKNTYINRLRNETYLPDPVLIASYAGNFTILEHFLPYWGEPPLTVLLILDRRWIHRLSPEFQIILRKGGMPHGLASFVMIERGTMSDLSEEHNSVLRKTPASLELIALYAARRQCTKIATERGCNLPDVLAAEFPIGIQNLVQLKKVFQIQDEVSDLEEEQGLRSPE